MIASTAVTAAPQPKWFETSNEANEMETFAEFVCVTLQRTPTAACAEDARRGMKLAGWIFQEVDFSSDTVFDTYDVAGAYFHGCTFPTGVCVDDLAARGADVRPNPPGLPFKPFRAFMYRQEELWACDTTVYQYFLTHKDVISQLHYASHDYSIKDSLYDYLEGKTVVAVMGGHGLTRASAAYRSLVFLARALARASFLVCTGGGPGAMEAANLGAYMWQRSEEEVEEALRLLQVGNDAYAHEFENTAAAHAVVMRFGVPRTEPSLGIATYVYGHEPPNLFAAWNAKMFSNAVREDGLLQIANGGVVYTPGSAGTRQEVFQDACRNHYAEPQREAPMVFFDSDGFWSGNGVFDLVKSTSAGRPYHDLLLCTSDPDRILAHLTQHRDAKDLPLVSADSLQAPFWYSSPCPHEPKHT